MTGIPKAIVEKLLKENKAHDCGKTAEVCVRIIAIAELPTIYGDYQVIAFENNVDGREHAALAHGDIYEGEEVPVRLHSECLTGDALGSLRCDCGEQLDRALEAIGRAERGVVLYLRHEGRGIGLWNKVRAYALQDDGLDTVDANVALGLPVDARDYGAAARVLKTLGVQRVRLITNNPEKIQALEEHGLEVIERVPVEATPNPVNARYLKVKAERMGHLLDQMRDDIPMPLHRPLVTVHYAQTIDCRI